MMDPEARTCTASRPSPSWAQLDPFPQHSIQAESERLAICTTTCPFTHLHADRALPARYGTAVEGSSPVPGGM